MSKLSKIIFTLAMLITVFSSVGPVLAQGSAFIPECALQNPTGQNHGADEGACRSVSIFVIMLLNFANYLFGIVGALALVAFIYGGFILILSRGTPDQVKKGKDAMVAAILGLVIVFGAYILVRFLGTAVGLKGTYLLGK